MAIFRVWSPSGVIEFIYIGVYIDMILYVLYLGSLRSLNELVKQRNFITESYFVPRFSSRTIHNYLNAESASTNSTI
jgi:hypothetical protein